MYDIIFVCTGNTCRSPMAEAFAKKIMPNLNFTSMGVAASSGSPASTNACKVMESEGLDISCHKSKMIDHELLQSAKLVLVMTKSHLSVVKSLCQGINAFTLGNYAGIDNDVSDPFGGDLNVYHECAKELKTLINVCADKFLNDFSS